MKAPIESMIHRRNSDPFRKQTGARYAEDIRRSRREAGQADYPHRDATNETGRAIPFPSEEIRRIEADGTWRISDPDFYGAGDHAAEAVSARSWRRDPGTGRGADQEQGRNVLSAAVREEV